MDEKPDEFAELLARIRSPQTRAASDALMYMTNEELAEAMTKAYLHYQSNLENLKSCGSATANSNEPKTIYENDNESEIDKPQFE